jgi:hypothetical protein
MPKGFKALVEIITWILFINGCVMLINTVVASIAGWLTPALVMAGDGIAIASFILAAVAARIRQKME